MMRTVLSSSALAVALIAATSLDAAPPGLEKARKTLEETGAVRTFVLLDASFVSTPASVSSQASKDAYRRLQDDALASLPPDGYRLRYRYAYSPSLFLEITDEAVLDHLAARPTVRAFAPDRRGRVSLVESRQIIRADTVREDLGYTGTGTAVAVIDTGVDVRHPDLEASIVHEHHFLEEGADTGPGEVDDVHGHGTHVAGIVTADGIESPLGVAPAADIVAIKAISDDGFGWISDWTAALEHAVALHESGAVAIDAVNMSFSTHDLYTSDCDAEHEPFFAASAAATELGICVVAAAGNRGRVALSLPACYGPVISVGSIGKSEFKRLSSFSNGNGRLDLAAPGEGVVAAASGGGAEARTGTSHATPQVAAAVCLLREHDGALSPAEIRAALSEAGPPTWRGFQCLDVLASIGALTVPRIEGIECEWDARSGTLSATWEPVAPNSAADAIHVELWRSHALETVLVLPPDATRLEYETRTVGLWDLWFRAGNGILRSYHTICGTEVTPDPGFHVRGDCNADTLILISDPVFTLSTLFTGDDPQCYRACEVNDDGAITITDAIYMLNFLFLGGPPPAAPYPDCELWETHIPCDRSTCL